jgi:hypothetical protein
MVLIASSVVEMMTGRFIAAKVKPPDRMDHPMLRKMTKNANPNNPKIIEGTPARQSVPKRIIRLTRLSRVYSMRKMAVPTPKGTEKKIATRMSAKVPIIVVRIPPSRPILLGDSIKNWRLRIGSPSERI